MSATPARELSSINFEAMLGGPLVAVVNAQAQSAMSSVNFIKSVGFKPALSADGQLIPGAVGEPVYVSFKYPKETAPYQPGVDSALIGLEVTEKGAGYEPGTPPAVTVGAPTAPGGRQATAKAVVNSAGEISQIMLDDPGSGYDTSAPTVTIAAASGQDAKQATATAVWQQGRDPVPAVYSTMQLEVPILTMLPIPFIRIEETTIDFNAKINSVVEAQTDSSFKVDSSLEVAGRYPPLFSAVTAKLKVNASYQKNTSSGSKVDRTYSMAVHIRATQDELPAGTDRILGILEDAIVSKPA